MIPSVKKNSEVTVLFVDDETSTLNSLYRLLRKKPYRILLADSGKKAIEVLEKESVDILVTDLRMPGMSGIDLLERISLLYPKMIRIVLSATTDVEEEKEVTNKGQVFQFVTKPLKPNQFKQTITEAVEHYHKELQ